MHKVVPLLHRHLQVHAPDRITEEVAVQLEREYHTNASHNLFLTLELLRLLKLLGEHGIPAVPFKGPVLAAAVYGETSLRMAGDLDILLERQNVLRARDLLLSLGYWHTYSEAREVKQLRNGHQYSFLRDDGRVRVEVQWGVTRSDLSSSLDEHGLWTRLQSVSLGGTPVPSLAPEDLLLLLCVHGTKHCWLRLSWICDVAELLRVYPALDWQWVLERTARHGASRMLCLGLLLAHDLLDAPLPEALAERVRRDRRAGSLAAQVRWLLFQVSPEQMGRSFPRRYELAFNLQSRERLRDKLRCFSALAVHLSSPHPDDETPLPLPRGIELLRHGAWPIRRFLTNRRKRRRSAAGPGAPEQLRQSGGSDGGEPRPLPASRAGGGLNAEAGAEFLSPSQ
jgi:hypothetical protein